MPTYAYRCKSCGHEFETEQRLSDDPLVKCPKCRKLKLVRLIMGSGLVFKGSGFYLTDYKKRSTSGSEAPASEKKEPAEKKTTESSGTPKPDGGGESKPAEKPPGKKKK